MTGDKIEKAIKALQESIQTMNAKMDTNHEVINIRMDEKQQEDRTYRDQVQQSLNSMNLMKNDLTSRLLELKTKDDKERKALQEVAFEFNSFQHGQAKLKREAKEFGVELKQERNQAEFEEEDKELADIRKGITIYLPLYLHDFKGEMINQVNNLIAEQDNPTQGKINNNEKLQKEKILLSKIKKHSSSIIIDEDNQIILECTKRFTDANLTPTTSMTIDSIFTKDNTLAILEIQQALINKSVKYSDWSMFLSLCCKKNTAYHLKDARGKIMPWKNCLLSIYKFFNFQKASSIAEDEIVNRQLIDGENVTIFMLKLTALESGDLIGFVTVIFEV
ncbi:Tkp3 protein [Vanderwaltozyma polyspora DSM 70294]|uniref:Tkp3 protein n=1 Tax=Vanderwaltozyma polyspora (strain ATCC 22028 / DSM 70294 / BCRC 21397 / CBS 2163 / NBRC 10782 / NRRL Y-8283 / UCD 57-17) TaxID=436907 RepID=A7TT59_VANPO|nr:Tkp3 protein [Vanderwaltozyma polyspora DSM 70294]EDO14544.1 Tkp3 protein [Vanderwaltozyma polyspora DSM 70294]